MQILGVILVLVLLYLAAVGLGLTRSFKRHKDAKKAMVIDDFEYENDDFDWTTGGYVKIEPSKENQTHGKMSAKATFLLSSQFFPTPTPGVAWQPQMILDTNSVTRLSVFEWQEYTSLKLDVFNPQDQPVTYHIQVADSRSYVYDASGSLTPKKVTNIAIPLDELIQKRLDLTSIRSFKFSVDTASAAQPVVVYLDYLRLEGDSSIPQAAPAAPQKK